MIIYKKKYEIKASVKSTNITFYYDYTSVIVGLQLTANDISLLVLNA